MLYTYTCFYWLRQIRRIRRSLDTESTKTLIHAFIASRVDYCNTVLAGSPRFITDRLQRVLNAAALHESSPARGSLTAACLICSTLSYIGWISINVFSISSESQFIGASRIVLPSTWWTAACVRLTFPVVSACGQPIGVRWSCHDIVAASSDADRSPLQLRWSGTRSGLSSGPNAEHRQLQIDIKDSPVRGATGHVAH